MIIKNLSVFNEDCKFENGEIYINKEFIADSSDDDVVIDGSGLIAIPGLTDIHTHGCNGHDFCEGTDEALDAITDYLAKNGITSFTPTSMTLPEERLEKIYTNFSRYENKKGAMAVGINMEGPFISPAKKGAQNEAYIKLPDVEMFERLFKASGEKIKQVALAPERKGALEFIAAVKDKTIVAIAHTEADYNTAKKAIDEGACNITHMYNAMPPLSHRAPGVVGAAFDSNCTAELICDGLHVDECIIRATFKMFTDERIVMISDSMMATGMPNGNYELGGLPVKVDGNRATLSDGTIAGSTTNLMDCLRQTVNFGIPLESAVKAAAVNPAKVIGEYGKIGSISKGKYANIVLLDKDLNIKKVFIKGKEYI